MLQFHYCHEKSFHKVGSTILSKILCTVALRLINHSLYLNQRTQTDRCPNTCGPCICGCCTGPGWATGASNCHVSCFRPGVWSRSLMGVWTVGCNKTLQEGLRFCDFKGLRNRAHKWLATPGIPFTRKQILFLTLEGTRLQNT